MCMCICVYGVEGLLEYFVRDRGVIRVLCENSFFRACIYVYVIRDRGVLGGLTHL
jgi:hypothetical protein